MTQSHCAQCRRKLRDAYFCPVCERSCCCWGCHTQHVLRHRADSPPAQPEAKPYPNQAAKSG